MTAIEPRPGILQGIADFVKATLERFCGEAYFSSSVDSPTENRAITALESIIDFIDQVDQVEPELTLNEQWARALYPYENEDLVMVQAQLFFFRGRLNTIIGQHFDENAPTSDWWPHLYDWLMKTEIDHARFNEMVCLERSSTTAQVIREHIQELRERRK